MFQIRRLLFLVVTFLIAGLVPVIAQDRSYGRSMVVTNGGIAATSQVLASQAGADVLRRGGSAIDAAIAANAVLGVMEPMMNGVGGDLFLIYWDAKSGKLYGLNASGWAPRNLSIEFLKKQGITAMPHEGIHSVTVPGAVDGWSKAHQRFGRLPWKDLFAPAIFYAEHGYAVAEIAQEYWEGDKDRLKETPEAARVFLPQGKVPAIGETFKNPDLARTLRLIADQGRDAFYRGEIAQAILKSSSALGGTMQADDLAEFSSEWVEPVSIDYRGWKVYELPPNGQGMAALEMLNIMGTFTPDPSGPQGAPELHKKIEAMKLAYTDLYRYNADPHFAKVPVPGLLSKDYAARRAVLIDPDKASCTTSSGSPALSDTTYLAVVDKEGNIASVIQSLYDAFGSGVAVNGMGFILQDRGGLFTLDASHPNALAPRKRPFHTIIPAFMERGDMHIGFGIMGGANQPLAHAQFVSNLVDYGMNIQAALEAPRFTIAGTAEPIGCRLLIESRVKPEVVEELRKKGHNIVVRKEYSTSMGRGQVVLHNSASGANFGASDPRADGSAEPEPLTPW
ncbi:MAG TPA: gamma-glutamyltransferase [Terriglobales bacterium]|jgi:gamma-glutamyltranspeptidase/glutathione hydrolase|nr:gamma-glutamyltransferase [Terriglobales bacterium]